MHKLFDTHAHYTDERLWGNFALLDEIFSGDVGYIACVASDIADAERCIELSEKYPSMYTTVGIHPHECEKCTDIKGDMDAIAALSHREKVVAIGEIGLDYHYDKDW